MAEVSNSLIITSNYNKLISLKATHGHYATSSSHINYFIDMTHLKCKRLEAKAVAEYIAQAYKTSTLIDTIVCMDGTEIVGAYLADELCSPGIQSVNSRNFIFIITPEQTTAGLSSVGRMRPYPLRTDEVRKAINNLGQDFC